MKKVLFLCTGNSCRSQMAEGFARKYWVKDVVVFSAGTQKHGMNELAVKVMLESGIDLSNHFSKTIEELPTQLFDLVVTVCDHAKENCPYLPAKQFMHVGFEDPPLLAKNMLRIEDQLAIYRRVRDEIERFIRTFNISMIS